MSLATVVTPDLTRVVLFAGLLLHKAVWEFLKMSSTRARVPVARPSRPRTLVKALKVAVLAFLLVQTLFLDVLPFEAGGLALRSIGLVVYALGVALALSGRLRLGKSWADLEDSRVRSGQALVVHGVYRYIRHPIYTGDLLLLTGLELALGSWLVLAVLGPMVVVIRQTRTEEALLSQSLPGYRAYCARTKRFIPFIV